MSAYVVDREHIGYLVEAATSRAILGHGSHCFRWYHRGQSHELPVGDPERSAEIGQMLWDENVNSVLSRYPDCTKDKLPGPIGEDFVYGKHEANPWATIDPVQVLCSCHCYRYQACEHPDWKDSEAAAFIDSLIDVACHRLPGYEKAVWGAPKRSYATTR